VSVPHRQLYRAVFSKELAVTACRSGVVSGYRLLYSGIPYVMAPKYFERMLETDPKATYEVLPARPVTDDTENLLVFFPGGIGDVISLKPVLQEFRFNRPEVSVAVASTIADQCLIGDDVALWDYPVTETVANQYDAWVNIAEMDRASVGQELMVSFAEYLGVEVPKWPPMVDVNFEIARALQGYIRDERRPRIGVHMDSACHFRSIPHFLGAYTMMELVDRGCDCYVLGGPENRIVFTNNGVASAPPDHIVDMTQVLGPLEYYIAFLEHMDVLLTCDTGAMHIAGACNIPTVALFGMTDGSKRTSYYPSVTYLQGETECSPCERVVLDPPCQEKYCESIAKMNPVFIADRVMAILKDIRSIGD